MEHSHRSESVFGERPGGGDDIACDAHDPNRRSSQVELAARFSILHGDNFTLKRMVCRLIKVERLLRNRRQLAGASAYFNL